MGKNRRHPASWEHADLAGMVGDLSFYVVGGEYRDTTFRELVKPDQVVGPFDSYEDAYFAWRARAMTTIDQAYARYQIVETAPPPDSLSRYGVTGPQNPTTKDT